MQRIARYDDEPCLVYPDADAYFELGEYALLGILLAIPDDVHLPSVHGFVEPHRVNSLCARLVAAVDEPET